MEYMGYTPDEIKKDKRKNTFYTVLVIIFLVMFAISLLAGVISLTTFHLDSASNLAYTSMADDETYFFDELIVVDSYAHMGNSTTGYVKDQYYLVAFTDRDDTLVYASLKLDSVSEMNKECEAYVENDSLLIGDMVLHGCFRGYNIGSEQQLRYFTEGYDAYKGILPGKVLYLNFSYQDAETIEEYRQNKISGDYIMIGVMAAFCIPCIIGIVLLKRKRKELDQYLAEYTAAVYNASVAYTYAEGDDTNGVF